MVSVILSSSGENIARTSKATAFAGPPLVITMRNTVKQLTVHLGINKATADPNDRLDEILTKLQLLYSIEAFSQMRLDRLWISRLKHYFMGMIPVFLLT